MVIKTLNTENPFADYGNIIEGNRFIGRKSSIATIHNRVLGNSFGNIAIIGLPRIGKSSLVWNALMVKKAESAEKNILIEWIRVSKYKNTFDFYIQLIESVLKSVKNKGYDFYDDIKSVKSEFIQNKNFGDIEFLFAFLRSKNVRVIVVLDEFDQFGLIGKFEDFQFLLDLSTFPDYKVCIVTISRKTIVEIEVNEGGAISNFHGAFSDLRLGVFNDEDLLEYWKRVEGYQIETSEDYKKSVYYLVGGHPFFIDLYNYEVFNKLQKTKGQTSSEFSEEIESEIRLTLFNNFENILNLLKDERLYTKAIQLILGPVYDVTSIDEQKLLKYEFIKLVDSKLKYNILRQDVGLKTKYNDSSYVCFSDYFTELMNLKLSDVDYWPLWNQTEKSVRELIKEYLEEEIKGENWELSYIKKHEKSEGKIKGIQKLDDVRTYTKKKFGHLASSHLVDYTFPRDMYDLFISSDWNWFEKILGETKNEWSKRFITLAEIRNPIAHNNSEFISNDELKSAKKYCEIILERISKWKEKESQP
jgi:hypothetical protein